MYLMISTYLRPIEEVDAIRPEHSAFIESVEERGLLVGAPTGGSSSPSTAGAAAAGTATAGTGTTSAAPSSGGCAMSRRTSDRSTLGVLAGLALAWLLPRARRMSRRR